MYIRSRRATALGVYRGRERSMFLGRRIRRGRKHGCHGNPEEMVEKAREQPWGVVVPWRRSRGSDLVQRDGNFPRQCHEPLANKYFPE